MRGAWLYFALLVASALFPQNAAATITLGQSVVSLGGPWKFHTGDDPRWADPNFDDSKWETVDLTAPPGAHDDDVGLTGYVPGWSARGHSGYAGYAWYRLRVSVNAQGALALAGPADVDSAYQVFLDGHLLGSDGVFSGKQPVVTSIQPRKFALPPRFRSGVIAFRVWMGAAAGAPDAGGIHIAPALGTASGVDGRYRLQWLQTVEGYVVEIVEPVFFLLLALMAFSLIPFDRTDMFYPWLIAALLLTAAARLNQAFYFWTQDESALQFVLLRSVFLDPMILGAWLMTWRAEFRLREPTWLPTAIGALTAVYMLSVLLSRSMFWTVFPHPAIAGLLDAVACERFLFVLALTFITICGIMRRGEDGWFALPSVILIAIGLFAQELSALHVAGIWFPYGVGVSRTQFAYAAFDAALFALLLRRLRRYARRRYFTRPSSFIA
ncbi:MAG TPA: hypothetical protein VHU87_11910 [Rhizomicrobium sp.]|jgi:hypothetical protein|nr:hypothetical protein [Rhizomicrobium sp.]